MKTRITVVVTLLVIGLFGRSCPAQQWRTNRYDTRWLPITETAMKKQTRASAHDVVALYQLWARARYQDQQEAYFSTLRKLKQEQPKNGAVLSTYCAVLMNSNAIYGFGQFKFRVDGGEGEMEAIRQNLKKAKLLSPKLWLNSITEAYLALFASSGSDVERTENAVTFCRYAVRLAPHITYTNQALGYALANLDMKKKTGLSEAVRCYKKAQMLSPTNCDASFLLVHVYRSYAPNKAEAAKAAQAILATIPPGTKLKPRHRQLLLGYGVPLPAASQAKPKTARRT